MKGKFLLKKCCGAVLLFLWGLWKKIDAAPTKAQDL
jgi:hypothetical protein